MRGYELHVQWDPAGTSSHCGPRTRQSTWSSLFTCRSNLLGAGCWTDQWVGVLEIVYALLGCHRRSRYEVGVSARSHGGLGCLVELRRLGLHVIVVVVLVIIDPIHDSNLHLLWQHWLRVEFKVHLLLLKCVLHHLPKLHHSIPDLINQVLIMN